VDINVKAYLAGGLLINHGIGIVVGSRTVSKGLLRLYQGVTLGGNLGKKQIFNDIEIDMPYIENNVMIFCGAKVLGPVIVGENSMIGSNAVVTKNVPPKSLVIGYNKILSL